MSIRNAAKAILIHDGKMLLNKNRNSVGDAFYDLVNGDIYYDFPGGKQNQYETLEEAVIRECMEESGYTVTVERLAGIYEEISMNPKARAEYEEYAHRISFAFICKLTDEALKPLAEKDLDMLQSEWIPFEDVKNIPLYPKMLRDNIDLLCTSITPVYFGSEYV